MIRINKLYLFSRFHGPGFGAHIVGLHAPGCIYTVRTVVALRMA
jgi:hypothetical protein